MPSPERSAALSASVLPMAGLALLSMNTVIWGLNWPIQKIALTTLDPWTLRVATASVGGFGMLAIALATRQSLRVPSRRVVPLIFNGLLTTTGAQVLSAYGVSLVNPGRAAILMFTFPLWAMLLSAVFLRARITGWQIVGLTLGMSGIGFLLMPDLDSVGSAPIGALVLILASICWAGGSILTQRFEWGMPTVVLSGWQSVIGTVPIVIVAVLTQPVLERADVSLEVGLAVAFSALGSSLFGIWAWFKVLTLAPAHTAGIGLLAVPIVGVFTSTLLLGDPLLWNELVALALVCGSIGVVLVLPALRRRQTPA